jgi:hypothetical protein
VTKTDSTLTVTAKAATVTANPKSKTYGDTNPALDAAITGTVNGDTLTYTLATTADTSSGVGSYPITVTLGSNPNYNVTKTDGTLTVTAKAATVVANDKSKIYGDANPTLDATVTGTVNGDTLSYTLATTATAPSGVGSYPITVTLGSNPNYTVTKTDSTLTVTAKTATVVADAKSKTYGDANPTLTAVVTGEVPGGDAITYSLTTAATAPSGVGSYPITVTLGANPNYTVTKIDSMLTVTAKDATVAANPKSKTYGDDNPALDAAVTGTVNGDLLAYTLATTAAKFSGVGSYAITVTLGTNPNYNVSKTDSTLTVTAKAATVAANPKSKTYGDANPALTAVVTGTVNGDTLTFSLATTTLQFSNVGDYPITVTLGANPNYSVTKTDGTLTVTPKDATVTANDKNKTYGDANPTLDATVTGTVNGDVLTYTLATTATATSGVGSYPITVTLGANPNYTVTKTDSTLAVTAKVATVAANPKSKTYGDTNPMLTAVVTGEVPGGDALNYTLATTATQFSGVGSYPITVTLGANPNYSVTKTDSTLTVTAKAATVAANLKSKTYSTANPALDATVTGTVNGDVLNYTLTTTALEFSAVGSYPITVTLGANPNYSVTKTDSMLTVTAKAATVAADHKTKTYGDANPALTAVVTGTVNGDVLNYTIATTATAPSEVGNYPITVTLGSNPNYSVTKTDSTLTITARPITVAADAKTKVYGTPDPALTYKVTSGSLVNGDSFSGSLTRVAGENVGTYAIQQGSLALNSSYNLTYVGTNLTITAATLTVTPDGNKTKIYGAPFNTFTGTVQGLQNSDAVTVMYASTGAAASAGVGSYDITVDTVTFTVGSASNYTITKNTAVKGLKVMYATSTCLGEAGHQILQPINVDGSSIFKQKSTVPAKFRVCDANGNSVGLLGVVVTFAQVQSLSDSGGIVNESVDSTTPDTAFRWDPTAQQWIFNMSTAKLSANTVYYYRITLNDGSTIGFNFKLK